MVKEALLALKERNGSSPYAIAKYMEEKFKPVPANFKKILSLQLKNQTMRGKLVKIKASYKLSEAEKKPKKEKRNAAAEKRKRNGAVGGKKSNKKKEVVNMKKKKGKKVSEPGKPKQPKSIKSSANKRARKATA
jgi:histone H1/5